MSDRGSGPTEAVIPLAPKLNARPDPSDPLEKFRTWLARPPVSPRQITSRPSKLVASYPLNFEVLKTGYGSLRQKSANTRTGRIEPRDGCIRFRWRLSRNSLAGMMVVPRSHRLPRHLSENKRP